MLIGYVVSGAVLCVWAEFIMLATNRTEAVVNESRAELDLYKGSRATFVEKIGRVERPVSWSRFPYGKGNEMIYESGRIYVNIRTLNRV